MVLLACDILPRFIVIRVQFAQVFDFSFAYAFDPTGGVGQHIPDVVEGDVGGDVDGDEEPMGDETIVLIDTSSKHSYPRLLRL